MKLRIELEELTSDILMSNDMYKIPVNVIKIAQNNNIDVFEGDLQNKASGAIRYDKDNDKFQIVVNKSDSLVRKRFTIAHELGHYFMHKDVLIDEELHIDTLYRNADESTKEREKDAEYFAGALLMNKLLIEKMYSESKSIGELAAIFDVSVSAMTVRLDVLNLI